MANALAKALAQDSRASRILVPWNSLRNISPLRGNLVVVLGSPGIGKSAFSLNWALKSSPTTSTSSAQQSSQNCALISLDTDLITQGVRAASILSGTPMSKIKQDHKAWGLYLERTAQHVRAYNISVSAREILGVVAAETEYWGEPPALTVVDNVSELVREGDYNEYRKVFTDLHRIARVGDTCIVALHHVTRGAKFGQPLTLTSGQFAGEQEAEIVLGLWSTGPEFLHVSFLKNRSGRADPSGNMYVTLEFDRERMELKDLTEETQALAALGGVQI